MFFEIKGAPLEPSYGFENNNDFEIEIKESKCCKFYCGLYRKMRRWFGFSDNKWVCKMTQEKLLSNILKMNIRSTMIPIFINVGIKIKKHFNCEHNKLEEYKQTHKDEEKCKKRKDYYRNHILQIKKYHETYNKLKSLRLNIFKKNLFVQPITEPKMNPEDIATASPNVESVVQMKPKRVRKPKVITPLVVLTPIIEPPVVVPTPVIDEPTTTPKRKYVRKQTVSPIVFPLMSDEDEPVVEPKPKRERTEKQKAAFANMVKAKQEKKEQMKTVVTPVVVPSKPEHGVPTPYEGSKGHSPLPEYIPCAPQKKSPPKPRQPRQPKKPRNKIVYVDTEDQEPNCQHEIKNEYCGEQDFNYRTEPKHQINNTHEINNRIVFC